MKSTTHRTKTELVEKTLAKEMFFIVGVAKSGTTWLQHLLDSHPEIVCRGESHFIDIFHASLVKAFEEYNNAVVKQGGVVAHLKEYGGHVDTLRYDLNDSFYLLVQAIGLMFGKWNNDPSIRLIGEKTPDNIACLSLLSSIFPSAKFIHIIRDGRDSAVSGWFFNQSGLAKNKQIVQTFDEYVRGFAKAWSSQINQGCAIGAGLDDRYMEVRYENLAFTPNDEATKLLRYLDVDDSEQCINNCLKASSFQSLTGGRRPGEEDPEAFFRKGVVGDWRNKFSDDLRDDFYNIAGDTLTRFGYEG
ncbi:MAG: sulfotransferase [Gammaproteobacteria bacterium]|nr:sulfotransferase [Gammaproteobacteria bacterium]MDH3464358.1 sulfotransferase [Gammaproteobacteria bacterium]